MIFVWHLVIDSPSCLNIRGMEMIYKRGEKACNSYSFCLSYSSYSHSARIGRRWTGKQSEKQGIHIFQFILYFECWHISWLLALSLLMERKWPTESTVQRILRWQTELSLPWTQAEALLYLLQSSHLSMHIETIFLCSLSIKIMNCAHHLCICWALGYVVGTW